MAWSLAALLTTTLAAGPHALSGEASNFVVHGTSQRRADAIRDHAEGVRKEAFARLLGTTDPAAWSVRCAVHVHAGVDAFGDAVGGHPATARGATSMEFTDDRVVSRRIDVMGDGPDIIPDALAHEIVHVVLADHFVAAAPPRWADEGIALLFDDEKKQRAHEADFHAARRQGLTWTAAELLELEDYPHEVGRQRVFYGQSAALVRWLIARRDAQTLIHFLDDCRSLGAPAAAGKHYDLDSIASLHLAWMEGPPAHAISRVEPEPRAVRPGRVQRPEP